jgi:hypothetical protein
MWASFFHAISYVSILTKNGLGYILGEFFKNSSGHLEAADTRFFSIDCRPFSGNNFELKNVFFGILTPKDF